MFFWLAVDGWRLAVSDYTENVPFPLIAEIQIYTFEFSGRVYVFDTSHCMVSAVIFQHYFSN